ncbi:alpha/beta fold hydrolase [Streptomyces sp. NPDC052496]|uniref:alpha/beta fold hydrolase n=1 Tax=Streptomyces sp. NPDC052496 TaxID=3154951 RepID=UPI00342DB661
MRTTYRPRKRAWLAPLTGASLLPPLVLAAPVTAAPTPAGPLTAYTSQRLDWHTCEPGLPDDLPPGPRPRVECATVTVPLDHHAPRGRTIGIAISRIRAEGAAAQRRGVLLFNPGGPGSSGIGYPSALTRLGLPQAVRNAFDLIGFDPRGAGDSTRAHCRLTPEEQAWPRPLRSFEANVAWARTVAEKCRKSVGGLLPHLTTRDTARDLDIIRAALGERRISYLGASYGTALGAVYTQLFPDRADRVVLDSAVDPALMWRAQFRTWGPEAEPAFTRWAGWTARHHTTYRLGRTPAAVRKTFWDLVARADRQPVVLGRTPYTGRQLRHLLRRELFSVRAGAEAVAQVRDAAAGKPVPGPELPTLTDQEISTFWSVVCNDAAWPRDPEVYRRDSLRDAARSPLYGDFAAGITPCAFWGESAERTGPVKTSVPLLILQNEWDSQTPLATARGLHRAAVRSRMVTVDEGEGHGVYILTRNTCAGTAATSYLVTGRLPARDLTCPAGPAGRALTGRGV